jgi:hypothetical protein
MSLRQLFPDEVKASIPLLYSQQDTSDPEVKAKFFTPDARWTFYVLEYDPEERIFFGLVDGFEKELGYFSLDELLSVRGPWGLAIERDIHFTPKPISKVNPNTGN